MQYRLLLIEQKFLRSRDGGHQLYNEYITNVQLVI